MIRRILSLTTHRIRELPIVVMMPHSRCNCRCVMCDIWKANHEKKEISAEVLAKHVDALVKLRARQVAFSGGEALMHSNLWALCELLSKENIGLTLLTTGMTVDKHASHIVRYFREVIVSVDGSAPVHDAIRGVPNGFVKLSAGVQALRGLDQDYRVTGRCVLQRKNYEDFPNIVASARRIGLHQISFLAADISSSAFNHSDDSVKKREHDLALNKDECLAFEAIIEKSFIELKDDYRSRFIAEDPEKMRRIVQYYKAINGIVEFPPPVCNAPWVSAVIESDGRVMPCFFHEPYGNLYQDDLGAIINSASAISFRRNLNVRDNSVCKKCVCSLKLGITQSV
jgi:MoaA/NifB/PqqE/SkfB family radical SAM enzyme